MQEASDEFPDTLIDVTGLSLSQLDAIDESSLARVLRHMLDGTETGPVAGFQASI